VPVNREELHQGLKNAPDTSDKQVVKTKCFGSRLTAGALLLAFLSGLALPATAVGGDIAVVVRPDTPVDDLTLSQTRKLFLGERQFWNSNLGVTLLVRAPVARERDVLLKVVYRMSEAEFKQYWILKMFRQEAAEGPKIVFSGQMAAELVTALPGSVTFVDTTQVPKGLKVLRIDGKLPGEAGYPLK
jgi:ABC-type phosphate transport system substrate-binding protein